MSVFSETTKAELARLTPDRECCRLSELSALMKAEATVQIGNTGRSITFMTEAATVARKIYNLLRQAFGIQCEITIIRKNRLRKNIVYIVRTGPKTDITPIMSLSGPRESLRICCAASYLRGTFLGCGSVMSPEKGYHLELVLEDDEAAAHAIGLANRFGLHLRVSERKGKAVCYLKDADGICAMLTLMGAHSSVLELESVRVMRGMRNGVNRLVNCETANVDKVVSASIRQAEAIEHLKARVGLDQLPLALRELIDLRDRNPDISLRELGELMVPKVGKSGVNHRMRRLMELAVQHGFRED